jgi:L-threonylcarbamoyladenylate synthase
MSELSALDREQIKKAIDILRMGGVVAYPTDTVYGLGSDIYDSRAVERIFRIKRRSHNLPLPVLIASTDQLASITVKIPAIARDLVDHFWPGALTIILRKDSSVPDIVTAGSDKIAVRIPGHPIPLAIIRGMGKPITGTSANVSGKPNPLTHQEVKAQLDENVDYIIKGGKCSGIESTIVDITAEEPVIIRHGAISESQLKEYFR